MPRDECVKKTLHENGIVPKSTFEVGDISTILTMVQEYIGVSILPELYIPLTIPKVVAIPLSPPINRQLVLAVRNWQAVSPLTAEFAVHSQKYMNGMEITSDARAHHS